MISNGLVVDEDAFSVLKGECEKIIDTQKRLPDFVFRRTFARYFAIEYGHIFAKEFAAFLFHLSNIQRRIRKLQDAGSRPSRSRLSPALILRPRFFRAIKFGGEIHTCAVA